MKRVIAANILVLLLFANSGCKSFRLLFHDINYKVPSLAEMQAAYLKNKDGYDSIAHFSFLLIDFAKANNDCVDYIKVGNSDINVPDFERCTENIRLDILEKDSNYLRFVNKVRYYAFKQMNLKDWVTIYKDSVLIPFKMVKESLNYDSWVSFVYTKNGIHYNGDPIGLSVYTNRNRYINSK